MIDRLRPASRFSSLFVQSRAASIERKQSLCDVYCTDHAACRAYTPDPGLTEVVKGAIISLTLQRPQSLRVEFYKALCVFLVEGAP